MTANANVARMARDEARSRRRVLIVTRTAHQATRVIEALEAALRPRDGNPKVMRGQGLWAVHCDGWGDGKIDVRVQGPGVRGMLAHTVLCDRGVKRDALRDAWRCTDNVPEPTVTVW